MMKYHTFEQLAKLSQILPISRHEANPYNIGIVKLRSEYRVAIDFLFDTPTYTENVLFSYDDKYIELLDRESYTPLAYRSCVLQVFQGANKKYSLQIFFNSGAIPLSIPAILEQYTFLFALDTSEFTYESQKYNLAHPLHLRKCVDKEEYQIEPLSEIFVNKYSSGDHELGNYALLLESLEVNIPNSRIGLICDSCKPNHLKYRTGELKMITNTLPDNVDLIYASPRQPLKYQTIFNQFIDQAHEHTDLIKEDTELQQNIHQFFSENTDMLANIFPITLQ